MPEELLSDGDRDSVLQDESAVDGSWGWLHNENTQCHRTAYLTAVKAVHFITSIVLPFKK